MTKKIRRKKLGITLPESLIKKVEKIEEEEMINRSKLVERLLKDYLGKK